MTTVVKKCTCTHPYQDKKYGKGLRVMNSNKKGDTFRCTVCKKEIR